MVIVIFLASPWLKSSIGVAKQQFKHPHQNRQTYCNRDLGNFIHESEYLGPYLLLQGEATTSIIINWVTLPNNAFHMEYRQKNKHDWQHVSPSIGLLGSTENLIHRALINNLKPSLIYEFRIVNLKLEQSGGVKYLFQTPPENPTESMTFVAGGDMMERRDLMAATTDLIALTSPAFALLGGDIAYDNGKFVNCWFDWLDIWTSKAITPQGLSIPIVIAIGNHEVENGYGQTPEQATNFYSLFLPNNKSNYVVDFSNYMSIYILDSNHSQRVEAQNNWLESIMHLRGDIPHSFAAYHVPAYGILKDGFANKNSTNVRKNWVPIFEKMGLNAAIEHHHHIYKRSKLIFKDSINAVKGILYIGDGGWGVSPRPLPKDMTPFWYIARAERKRHFLKITINENMRTYEAIDSNGTIFDRYIDVRQ